MLYANVHDTKTNLSKYLAAIAMNNDEVVIICNNGAPVAQITKINTPLKRKLGIWKGKVKMSDDFDAPLPHEFMRHFE